MSKDAISAENDVDHLEHEQPSLETIPADVLAKCLQHLTSTDVHNLESCSRAMQNAVKDPRCWFELCSQLWSTRTDIRLWLPSSTTTPTQPPPIKPPTTYRQLYQMLKIVSPLVGIWRIVGIGPESGLITCTWKKDGIQIDQLDYNTLEDPPERTHFASIFPRRGLTCKVEWGDDDSHSNVTLVDMSPVFGLKRTPSACETTEAVASAALPFSPGGSSSRGSGNVLLGSSPPGSFESEWLSFMAQKVSISRSKSKRKSFKGPPPQPVMHHLKSVVVPKATVRHPLAGLWLGHYGHVAGMQVVVIRYDFSLNKARIIAEKVTGDVAVPAGSISFTSTAASLPHPLPEEDSNMIATWQQRHWDNQVESGGIDTSIEDLLIGDIDDDILDAETSDGGTSTTSSIRGMSNKLVNVHSQRHRQIVSVHVGKGYMADGERVEGRLWIHSDGTISFHWLTVPLTSSVTMRRISMKELRL